MTRWFGWHFLPEDRRLRWDTHEVVEAGATYTCHGPLNLCSNGLHASRRALDALDYAPGPIVCAVELVGERKDGTDKACARSRRVLWLADATPILHEFGLIVATEALCFIEAVGETVDPRSWAALDVKQRWLRGRATDAQLDAAWADAGAAAWAVAGAAARAPARAAAWAVAWAAARAAARAVAWAAARAVARDAAWADAGAATRAPARAAQNDVLTIMLQSLKP